jgi:hypothetical protein
MEQHHPEPQPPVLSSVEGPTTQPTIRHDGWTGEKMAIFCETLAETGVVEEACEVAMMGVSGAYAARRRSPIFAAAWQAALSIGRERLADRLLSRAIEGNVEQIYRDGELVGERHAIDNRLGLAILRRLDRLAETGQAVATRGAQAVTLARHPNPRTNRQTCAPASIDWTHAIHALREGDDAGVAHALALTKGHEVEEVEDPPVSPGQGDNFDPESDQSDRCWWDESELCWMTDFPPPPGFDGYETRDYGDLEDAADEPYRRECSPEEVAILEADRARAHGAARIEDEERRDAWFALLKADAEMSMIADGTASAAP